MYPKSSRLQNSPPALIGTTANVAADAAMHNYVIAAGPAHSHLWTQRTKYQHDVVSTHILCLKLTGHGRMLRATDGSRAYACLTRSRWNYNACLPS